MSVVTDYSAGGCGALPNTRGGRYFTMRTEVDCSKLNVASGDIVKLWGIPANTLVKNVIAQVATAEGGTLTIDVGDYLAADDSVVDSDGYLDGVNGNAAAMNQVGGGSTAYANGKLYTADSYIGALFNNAADAAVITFIVECVDCR